jgi:general secretion pathway protein D
MNLARSSRLSGASAAGAAAYRRAYSFACLLALVCVSASRAQEQPPPARIFGVELERGAEVDRLLVLAAGEVEAELIEESPQRLLLRITNAVLDERAQRQIVSGSSQVIRDVVMQASAGPPPRVEIRTTRAAGARAELTRRGAIVALEVEREEELAAGALREGASVRIDLRDKPIVDLVRAVQRATGQRFVWDDRLQGTVTVIAQDPITPGEALELLLATLPLKGFAAAPAPDGTLLILPLDEARSRAPRERRALRAERAGLITVLTRFRSANAEQLVNLLAPFAGAALHVVAYPPTNGVILVGAESGIHRWLELARALDETTGRELAVIRPRHRSAAELHALLSQTVLDPLSGRPRAELFLDERTNALIVRANADALASVRAQAEELDRVPPGDGEVLVIRPRFADLEKLAAQIESLGRAPVTPGLARTGGPTRAAAALSVARHPSSRALLVRADAPTQREVRQLVESLDVEPPLIELEVNVLEVATTGELALGVDAFVPSTDPSNPGNVVFGGGLGDPFELEDDALARTFVARWARNPVVVPVIGPGGVPVNVTLPREIVQLTAAGGAARVRTLMQPRLVTLGGEAHEFSAGLNVPIPSAATESAAGGAQQDSLQTRVNIERKDVGLRLRLEPTVGDAGSVRVVVDLEVTALQATASASRADVGPDLASRALKATATLANGDAAVLGMALERASLASESGAPFLKDTPVLGNLLRQSRERNVDRTLLVTLQARVLRSLDERLADTIRVRTAHERALARSGTLRADGSAWALLVATRPSRVQAEALAAELGKVAGKQARVVPWEWDGAERFDVLLTGFRDVRAAAAALSKLAKRGLSAELVAIPSPPD